MSCLTEHEKFWANSIATRDNLLSLDKKRKVILTIDKSSIINYFLYARILWHAISRIQVEQMHYWYFVLRIIKHLFSCIKSLKIVTHMFPGSKSQLCNCQVLKNSNNDQSENRKSFLFHSLITVMCEKKTNV